MGRVCTAVPIWWSVCRRPPGLIPAPPPQARRKPLGRQGCVQNYAQHMRGHMRAVHQSWPLVWGNLFQVDKVEIILARSKCGVPIRQFLSTLYGVGPLCGEYRVGQSLDEYARRPRAVKSLCAVLCVRRPLLLKYMRGIVKIICAAAPLV